MAEQRWFEPIDPELLDEERAEVLLEQCRRVETLWREGHPAELTDADMLILRQHLHDGSTRIRNYATAMLCLYGDVTWEDFEALMVDTAESVRKMVAVFVGIPDRPLGSLCREDKRRCAEIMYKAVERYGDLQPITTWEQLAKDSEWLSVLTSCVDRLLELGRPEINDAVSQGALMDIEESRSRP